MTLATIEMAVTIGSSYVCVSDVCSQSGSGADNL